MKKRKNAKVVLVDGLDRRELLKGMLLVSGALFAGALPKVGWAQSSVADVQGVEILDHFLKEVNTLKANFTQKVLSPDNERVKTSSGTFVLSRPNRFRFDYLKPYEQQIISDGEHLWLYDKDLEQVTQSTYSEAIDSTPAALLAGGASATTVQENFNLKRLPDADGLQWVQAQPKRDDGQIHLAKIGFRDGALAVLEITDNFRQKSTLTFSNLQTNVEIADALFDFKVPEGVDLISK